MNVEQLESRIAATCLGFEFFPAQLDEYVKPPDSEDRTMFRVARQGLGCPTDLIIDFDDGNIVPMPNSQYVTHPDSYQVPGDYVVKLIDNATDEVLATWEHTIIDWYIPGDVDYDGHFDSSDLVEIFQAGKYETGETANRWEGDYNFDGVFTSADLVKIMQDGEYEE